MKDKNEIKIKERSLLARIAAAKLGEKCIAVVMGKTIHLYGISKDEFLKKERWLRHELVHVKQFEQYGYITFLVKYLAESIRKGYYNNKYEVEARAAENGEQ